MNSLTPTPQSNESVIPHCDIEDIADQLARIDLHADDRVCTHPLLATKAISVLQQTTHVVQHAPDLISIVGLITMLATSVWDMRSPGQPICMSFCVVYAIMNRLTRV